MTRHLTLFTTSPPFALDWEDETAAPPKPVFDNPALEDAERMACAHCGADVTLSGLRIAVGGSHRHLVPTAYGIDREIGCFSVAPGCSASGHFALEFGKSSDGFWQMALCAHCGAHLGWRYESTDATSFFGLILDQLTPGRDDRKAA